MSAGQLVSGPRFPKELVACELDGQGSVRAFAGKTFDDGGSDASATSSDKSAFVLQLLIHRFERLRSRRLDGLWGDGR